MNCADDDLDKSVDSFCWSGAIFEQNNTISLRIEQLTMSLVDIKPDVLEFKSPFTVQSTESAIITNNSDETIAFKVKTTAPKFYCVRPNAAVVAPGESVEVQVILLGLAEEPSADFKCRDKFLVITLPSPYELGEKTVAEAWPALEAEFKQQAVSKKMKVKYTVSTEPVVSQPADEVVDKSQVLEDSQIEEKQIEQEQVPSMVQEQVSQPEKVAAAVATPTKDAAKTTQAESEAAEQDGSLNSNTLILIALIALILGWLYY